MELKICPECNVNHISAQYLRCAPCNVKAKENKPEIMQEILFQLKLMNNNLAHMRAELCKDDKLKASLKKEHKKNT